MLLSDNGHYQAMRFRQKKKFINLRKKKKKKKSLYSLILYVQIQWQTVVLNHRARLGGSGKFGTFGPLCDNTGNRFFLNLTNVFSHPLIAAYVRLCLLVFRKSDYCRRGMGRNRCSPKLLLAGWEGSGCPLEYLSGNGCLSRASPTDARPRRAPFCWWRGWLISAYLTPTQLTEGGEGGW